MASKAIVQKTQVTFPSIYPDVNAVNPVTVGRFCVTQALHEFPVQKKNPASLSRCPWGPSLLPDVGPVKRDAAKIEDPGSSHGKQTSNRREAEQSALPELGAEHTTSRQTVIGNGPAFDTPNNATGGEEDEEIDHLEDKKQGGGVRTRQQQANHPVGGNDHRADDREENEQPPTSAKFRGTVEHTMGIRGAKGLLGLAHRIAGFHAGEYDVDLTFVPDRMAKHPDYMH